VDDGDDYTPADAPERGVIDVDVDLPLADFGLRVAVRLERDVSVVMGPSGSGKTSLLETLAGLRPTTRGRLVMGDVTLLDSSRGVCRPPEARGIGYVPQDMGLFPHLSALDNVRFGARGATDAMHTAIDTLGIRQLLQRYPAALSGGERQRVALARALATRPRLLLLDEPLAALDLSLRERVLPYLVRIRDEWRVPMVYVTHNVGEALALGGELLLLRAGRVEAQGAPLDLLAANSLARDAEAGIENLLPGELLAHDASGGVSIVQLKSGPQVAVPLATGRALGTSVTVAIRAEDILICAQEPHGLSARNVYAAHIESLVEAGADATLRCVLNAAPGHGGWLVRVTRSALRSLALHPGLAVWLAVKSHSVRLL
jgi:molybdate transport system ATP-binding protein